MTASVTGSADHLYRRRTRFAPRLRAAIDNLWSAIANRPHLAAFGASAGVGGHNVAHGSHE